MLEAGELAPKKNRERFVAALRKGAERAKGRLGKALGSSEPEVGHPEVCFEAKNGEVVARGSVPMGTTLLQAAKLMAVDIDHYCGGNCSCGTCRVEILGGAEFLSQQDGMEAMVLGAVHVDKGRRLACQSCVTGPVRVRVPEWF